MVLESLFYLGQCFYHPELNPLNSGQQFMVFTQPRAQTQNWRDSEQRITFYGNFPFNSAFSELMLNLRLQRLWIPRQMQCKIKWYKLSSKSQIKFTFISYSGISDLGPRSPGLMSGHAWKVSPLCIMDALYWFVSDTMLHRRDLQ